MVKKVTVEANHEQEFVVQERHKRSDGEWNNYGYTSSLLKAWEMYDHALDTYRNYDFRVMRRTLVEVPRGGEDVTDDPDDLLGDHMWRTQVQIMQVSVERVWVRIPAWVSQEWVALALPTHHAAEEFRVGGRYHVKTNLGAETASELRFADWEV